MDLMLRGRAAFVAASSRGIGRAIAEEFAREGADVGMCSRDRASLDEAAAAVRLHGVRTEVSVADVTDKRAVVPAVDATTARFGRLDALVVNAGGPPVGTFTELGDDEWRQAYDLTLMSAVQLIRAALPALRRSDAPSILIVSSMSVRQPVDNLVLSTSMRLALAGLAKSLAGEEAPVRVNTVLSGYIATERSLSLARARATSGMSVDDVIAATSATVPLHRYGEPAELARVAVFLSSSAASYVTGSVIAVDGGAIAVPI